MELSGTHRLPILGITSPFDLPEDPYYLLELFAIVLCRRIHFLSVKTSHYFSSNVGTPEFNPQGNQDNRTVRADNEFGARDSHRNRNRNSATPLSQIEGEAPDVYIFHLRDISRESLLGRSASTDRTGGPDNNQLSNSLRKLRSIFLTFKNHLWQRN